MRYKEQYLLNFDACKDIPKQKKQTSPNRQTRATNGSVDREYKISILTELLWAYAEKHETVKFNALLKKLNTVLSISTSRKDFTAMLETINRRSKARYGCLLTAIVLGSGNIPGRAFFYLAKKLNSTTSYVSDLSEQERLAKTLQESTYTIAQSRKKNIQQLKNESEKEK